jgi:hypothetical protein
VVLPDGTPDNFVDLLAQVQNVHALVSEPLSGVWVLVLWISGRALWACDVGKGLRVWGCGLLWGLGCAFPGSKECMRW